MAAGMRKGVVLGNEGSEVRNGVISADGYYQRFSTCESSIRATNTPWVRIWADWSTIQPSQSDPVDNPTFWAGVDAGVKAANTAGRYVLLTAWRCPLWASGRP